MANDVNIEALLDKPAEDFKAPAQLPEGSYLFQVLPEYKFDKIGKNQTDTVNYQVSPVQPGPEVDEDALREALGDRSLSDVRVRAQFFLTPDSLHRLVGEEGSFAVNCGIDVHGKTAREIIQEVTGQQVWGQLVHKPNPKEPNRPYVEIASWAPAS